MRPGLQAERAADELHADRRGDQRGADHRAQLEHERRQERDPQRGHRLGAVALADVGERLRLGVLAAVRAQRRQPAHDVEEVRAEQRERAPAPRASALRAPLPIRTMKTIRIGTVSARIARGDRVDA